MVGLLLFATLLALSQARLAPLLHAVQESAIPDNYIVVYKDDVSLEALNQDIATAAHRFSISFTYEHVFKGYSANLTTDQLMSVRQNPNVRYVEQDQIMRAIACSASVTVNSWGLSRIAERKQSLNGKYSATTNAGNGVTAYIIDTGIYVQNTEFGGRATFGWKANSLGLMVMEMVTELMLLVPL